MNLALTQIPKPSGTGTLIRTHVQQNNLYWTYYTALGDNNYPTGGYTFTDKLVKDNPVWAECQSESGGYIITYNYTTNKVQFWTAPNMEVGSGTDVSAETVRLAILAAYV